jgi:hypothetical protein
MAVILILTAACLDTAEVARRVERRFDRCQA